jgi:hypothetical protein
VGTATAAEIAAMLTAEFAIPRTETAVIVRCKRLGLSVVVRHFTASQVGRLFGVDGKTVTASWIGRGWLAAGRVHDVPGGGYVITAAQLEAFIRSQRHVYDWRQMRPGQWRNLAEVVWKADPLLALPEAARQFGCTTNCLSAHIRRGWLPAYQQPLKASHYRWLVARSALQGYTLRRPDLVGNTSRPQRAA